jgi:hypothetical protein
MKDHSDINDTLRKEGLSAARARHDGAAKFNGGLNSAQPASGGSVNLRTHRDGSTASPKWLVKKLLPQRGIGLLSGQWGMAKTGVVLDLAAALAMKGGTFAGLPIRRRGVALLFFLEGGSGIPDRLETLSRDKYAGADIPIYYTTEETNLLGDGGVERVIEIAHEAVARAKREWNLPLTLIGFDTLMLASGYPGEGAEQDNVIGTKLMQALRQIETATGALVIGIDHYGKNAEAGSRGASAKEDASDVIIALLGNRSPGGKVTDRRMVLRKIRSGAAGAEHPFDLKTVEIGRDEDGEVETSVVVDWKAAQVPIVKPKAPGKASALLLHVIKSLPTESHRPWADGLAVQAVPESAVRAEFYRQYLVNSETDQKGAAEAKKKAFKRALTAAQPEHVMHREGWLWLSS